MSSEVINVLYSLYRIRKTSTFLYFKNIAFAQYRSQEQQNINYTINIDIAKELK